MKAVMTQNKRDPIGVRCPQSACMCIDTSPSNINGDNLMAAIRLMRPPLNPPWLGGEYIRGQAALCPPYKEDTE